MTYEDVKRIRENPTSEDVDNKELHELIDKAVDKQIPKKVNGLFAGFCKCGKCVFADMDFCSGCGQALDWSEAIEYEKAQRERENNV